MIWPLPIKVYTGPIINYAFEDKLLLSMPLRVSETAVPGEVLTIKAQAAYLICYEVCIPEFVELSLPLLVGEARKDNRWHGNIEREINKAPKVETGYAATTRLESGHYTWNFPAPIWAQAKLGIRIFSPTHKI